MLHVPQVCHAHPAKNFPIPLNSDRCDVVEGLPVTLLNLEGLASLFANLTGKKFELGDLANVCCEVDAIGRKFFPLLFTGIRAKRSLCRPKSRPIARSVSKTCGLQGAAPGKTLRGCRSAAGARGQREETCSKGTGRKENRADQRAIKAEMLGPWSGGAREVRQRWQLQCSSGHRARERGRQTSLHRADCRSSG